MLALLRRPVLRPALALALLAPLLALSSLARQPGYELATALGLMLTLVGNLPAMALVQGRREQGRGGDVLDLFLAAWGLNVALCLPALAASLFASYFTTPCDPLAGLPFCLVLIPSAAAITAASGLVFSLGFIDRRRAELGYLVAALISAGASSWPIVSGPQVFAYNVFAGYFPGPIYDEALRITPALLWARVGAAVWTLAAVALAASCTDPSTLAWSWRSRRWRPLGLLGVSLLGLLALRLDAAELGTRSSIADIERLLAGLRETAHFRIHYPAERSRSEIDRLARDLEFRYAQDAAFLGVEEEQKIDAYYYRSAEEKQRWVGAAETDFAKPWLHQFHLQLEGVPDPVAKHELAHVMANVIGVKPFGTAGGSLIPNAGLIEGLATAADNPIDDLTLDQLSAAMRKLGVAPEISSLFSAAGFWTQEQGRAYTEAGAFLRWIALSKGTKALQALYHSGDFAGSCGAPLEVLAKQWGEAVDRAPLDDRAMHLAQRRYSAPSLFSQVCARETAALREQAQQAAGSDPERARGLLERLVALQPGNPDPLFAVADLLFATHRLDDARAQLGRVIALPNLSEAPRARAELELATMALQAKDETAERTHLQAVIQLQPDTSTTRHAELQLSVAGDSPASAALDTYFRQPGREQSLLRLQELLDQHPALAAPRYLLGRRLTDLAQPQLAEPFLQADLSVEDQEALPEVAREWLRLRIRDEAALLECDRVAKDAAALLALQGGARTAAGAPDAVWTADWSARCEFERATFHTPVEAE